MANSEHLKFFLNFRVVTEPSSLVTPTTDEWEEQCVLYHASNSYLNVVLHTLLNGMPQFKLCTVGCLLPYGPWVRNPHMLVFPSEIKELLASDYPDVQFTFV